MAGVARLGEQVTDGLEIDLGQPDEGDRSGGHVQQRRSATGPT
jgi:hypothetical protein